MEICKILVENATVQIPKGLVCFPPLICAVLTMITVVRSKTSKTLLGPVNFTVFI